MLSMFALLCIVLVMFNLSCLIYSSFLLYPLGAIHDIF